MVILESQSDSNVCEMRPLVTFVGNKAFQQKFYPTLLEVSLPLVNTEDKRINHKFDKAVYKLSGKKYTMGIIETIKQIEREEGREEGKLEGKQEGLKEGIEKTRYEFVRNLILGGKLSIKEIASAANVSQAYVRRLKSELTVEQ